MINAEFDSAGPSFPIKGSRPSADRSDGKGPVEFGTWRRCEKLRSKEAGKRQPNLGDRLPQAGEQGVNAFPPTYWIRRR